MGYVGGIRSRLVRDSVYHMLDTALDALGWFESGRFENPVSITLEPVSTREQIPLNTIAIEKAHTRDEDGELGSTLGIIRSTFYVDFYAEDDDIGQDLINDVRDMLKGRMPSIDRGSATVPVYDWSVATPDLIFVCDIEDVAVDKARDFPKPWQQHWWSCAFTVVDEYGGEEDT